MYCIWLTSTPKFCSNCGETLNLNEEIKKCSKCGIDQQQQQVGSTTQIRPIVDQLPYKSPGTAALIAFIGGIFVLLDFFWLTHEQHGEDGIRTFVHQMWVLLSGIKIF